MEPYFSQKIATSTEPAQCLMQATSQEKLLSYEQNIREYSFCFFVFCPILFRDANFNAQVSGISIFSAGIWLN